MMFGQIVRKPRGKWYFEDNHITGICARRGNSYGDPNIILPRGLTSEQTDLVLWAYEFGHTQGLHSGEDAAKRMMRQSLGISA